MAATLVAVAAEPAKNLLKDANKPARWQFEQHEQAKGSMKADQDAILFDVTNVDGELWHVQVFMHDVEFKEGKEYTLTYKAKGDPARSITATATIDEDDWHAIGLQEEVELTKDWKEQSHTFKPENVVKPGKNRLGFFLGNEKGKVWIKDVSLTEK
jgi:hypothetical protein